MDLANSLWGKWADLHVWLFVLGFCYAVVNRLWWSEFSFGFAAMVFSCNLIGWLINRGWMFDDWKGTLTMLSVWSCIWVTAFAKADTLNQWTVF